MILCIDTALSKCAVSLVWEGKSIDKMENEDAYKASEILHILINKILAKNYLSLKDLKAIAINGGPGSYTGLRIGATTAKGLCYALDIPLIHLDGLMLLTIGLISRYDKSEYDYYIPMIDARRSEVFTAIYNSKLEIILEPQPIILSSKFVNNTIDGKIIVFGDGADKASCILDHPKITFFKNYTADITDFKNLSWEKYLSNSFVNHSTYSPNYLKSFYINT